MWGGCRLLHNAALAALLALLATVPLAAAQTSAATGAPQPRLALSLPVDRNRDGQPVMTVTKAVVAGREVYYEVPQAPVGVLAFFHGCSHNAYDHWQRQPGCEECRGLPGEVSHTKQALALGYAFIAINSLDRSQDWRCFSWTTDRRGAVDALRTILPQLGLQGLPLYLAGVSAGAAFAMRLPAEMGGQVAGVISEVLALDPRNVTYDWSTWPPVAFIAMKKDQPTNDRIARNQAALQQAGVPAQTIHVPDRAIYPTFFSDQASDIGAELSEKTVAALKQLGILDSQGVILADPRHGINFDWRGALRALVPELAGSDPASSLAADASHVSELLNTAYSSHEIVGDYTTAALRWLEGGGRDDLAVLTEKLVIRKPVLLTAVRLQPGQEPVTAGDPEVGALPSPPSPSPPPPSAAPLSPPPPQPPAPQQPPLPPAPQLDPSSAEAQEASDPPEPSSASVSSTSEASLDATPAEAAPAPAPQPTSSARPAAAGAASLARRLLLAGLAAAAVLL